MTASTQEDPLTQYLANAKKFQEQGLHLAAAETFAKAFVLNKTDGDIALMTGRAYDAAASVRAIGYYGEFLKLSPGSAESANVKQRIAELECLQLCCRSAAMLVTLREYFHKKPGFTYQNPNMPINEFNTLEELAHSRMIYGRMIEYYVQAARTDPASFLPHTRLMELGLYTGSESLAMGAAGWLQQHGMPLAFSADFYFGDNPRNCIEDKQEDQWGSPVSTLPDMHVLRRGLMLVDERGISFYDRPASGWFVKDRAQISRFFDDYRQVKPLLTVEKEYISDIGHYIRENFWGDVNRWQLNMHTRRWYDVPQLDDYQENKTSRTFIFAPMDGIHVEATQRLAVPWLSWRNQPKSRQLHYSRNWSQRLALVLKEHTNLAGAVQIDEAEKFHHEEDWYNIWCDPDPVLPVPKSADDYAGWIQTAPIRSIDELEEATVAFSKEMEEILRSRKYGHGSFFH